MARISQRSIPLILIGLAVALLAVRIGVSVAKREPAGPSGPVGQSKPSAHVDLVRWVTPEEGMRLAQQTGKPILFDFTADWCQPCHMLDAEVFRNAAIAKAINERYIAIRVVDRKREDGRNTPGVDALQQRYAVRGYPTVVFADAALAERGRMEGFGGRDEFERVMERSR